MFILHVLDNIFIVIVIGTGNTSSVRSGLSKVYDGGRSPSRMWLNKCFLQAAWLLIFFDLFVIKRGRLTRKLAGVPLPKSFFFS